VNDIADETARFSTFQADRKWLPHGEFETARLVRLMGSRRSCRNFKDTPVDRAVLEDLVKVGITAPSGTNSQLWTFSLLPSHKAVQAFAGQLSLFYRKVLQMTDEQLPGPEYREVIERILSDRENRKIDRMFHGAPAVIIIGSRPGASCPAEDALLAAQNILLAAHSMGLGTCLIGFAVQAMNQDASLKSMLGIPVDEAVHCVISLGYPDETYRVIPARKQYTQRYFEG
jgi:nitroreductase